MEPGLEPVSVLSTGSIRLNRMKGMRLNQSSDNERLSRRRFLGTTAGAAAALAVGARTRSVLAQATPSANPAATGTRTFVHAMGTAEIPAAPQRVVVLDGPILDSAIAVGVVPVGATTGIADAPWPEYLGDAVTPIVNVGTIEEPDLEKIVGVQPDLILGSVVRNEAIYPRLAEIAPTVISNTLARDWREGFLFFTDALNQADKAAAVIERYETKVAAVKTGLGDQLANTSVSVLRILGPDIRSYNINSFSGTILQDIGIPRPEIQQAPEDSWTAISLEQLGAIDASAIFVTLWGGNESAPNLAELNANPLWTTLSAVRNNHVFLVPDEYWMTGIGYLAADRVLDDLISYLVDGTAPAELPAS
jgi:iron complex transport system substrate-binding protein